MAVKFNQYNKPGDNKEKKDDQSLSMAKKSSFMDDADLTSSLKKIILMTEDESERNLAVLSVTLHEFTLSWLVASRNSISPSLVSRSSMRKKEVYIRQQNIATEEEYKQITISDLNYKLFGGFYLSV
jgi:hypothetical protein